MDRMHKDEAIEIAVRILYSVIRLDTSMVVSAAQHRKKDDADDGKPYENEISFYGKAYPTARNFYVITRTAYFFDGKRRIISSSITDLEDSYVFHKANESLLKDSANETENLERRSIENYEKNQREKIGTRFMYPPLTKSSRTCEYDGSLSSIWQIPTDSRETITHYAIMIWKSNKTIMMKETFLKKDAEEIYSALRSSRHKTISGKETNKRESRKDIVRALKSSLKSSLRKEHIEKRRRKP